MHEILVVEDEHVFGRSIATYLSRRGFHARHVNSAEAARDTMRSSSPELIFLDYRLPHEDGLQLLRWVHRTRPNIVVIIMTGYGDIPIAVEAMKLGAKDFLTKPVSLAALASIANDALGTSESSNNKAVGLARIVGNSSAANGIRLRLRKLGEISSELEFVSIVGPRGIGKGLVALALHEYAFADEPKTIIDCKSVSESEFRSSVFPLRPGTLILLSGSYLSHDMQLLLTRALRHKPNRFRVLMTTRKIHGPEKKIVAELSAYMQRDWVELPSLVERASDIVIIAETALREVALDLGVENFELTANARAKLVSHAWPGNIVELVDCVTSAVSRVRVGEKIDAGDLEISDRVGDTIRDLHYVEVTEIQKALDVTDGNVSRAAVLLGISRDTLRYRMAKYNIPKS